MKIRLSLLKSNYAAQLRANVQSGNVIPYTDDECVIDMAQTLPMNIEFEEDIASTMYGDSSHEYEDAIILYEALKDLPEVMAADPIFWESLAHTVFHPFLKKRWGRGNLQTSVYNHWFMTNSIMRHGLAGLWWGVRLTIDPENTDDEYRLTKVLFWNYSFRTTFAGPSIFFRVTNARTGILRYLADHEELRSRMENAGRYIAMHFNRLGAVKQLAALSPEYFYNELEKRHDDIISYKPRNKRSIEEESLSPDLELNVMENDDFFID